MAGSKYSVSSRVLDLSPLMFTPSRLVAHQASAKQQDVDPSVGLQEFFGFRHERVIVEAVEESYRDCLRQGILGHEHVLRSSIHQHNYSCV